jgi:hypothetical protein
MIPEESCFFTFSTGLLLRAETAETSLERFRPRHTVVAAIFSTAYESLHSLKSLDHLLPILQNGHAHRLVRPWHGNRRAEALDSNGASDWSPNGDCISQLICHWIFVEEKRRTPEEDGRDECLLNLTVTESPIVIVYGYGLCDELGLGSKVAVFV